MNSSPVLVPLKKILANPYQPRTDEDPAVIAEIAVNIFRNGLMQTPSARAVNGHYELVFGHTRRAAFELLATKGVPAADIAPDKRFAEMPLQVRELSDRQMFEMAVAENIKRRDLNSIEQATAMKRYMDEFKANSKEAAELFGVNDATVRGKVRLLDLPEEAQQKLAAGAISEGTARTLLSMQKVAPKDLIIQTIARIEKNKNSALPDDVIEDSINRSKSAVQMWDDDRHDGKPRSAWSNGWLLDMKNFPNKLLPAMSEEAVGVYEKQIEHLVNPPACTACPFYTKVRGSHYCGLKICYERKTSAWYELTLQQASKNLGIAIYDKEDGKFAVLDSYDNRTLFNSKHKGLRLIAASQVPSRRYQYFSGIEADVILVVATGEAIKKMHSKSTSQSIGGKKSLEELAEMRMMRIYRVRRKELLWEFAGIAKVLLDGVPFPVLEHLERNVMMDDQPKEEEPDDDAKTNVRAEYLRKIIMYEMCISETGSSHYRRESMADIIESLQEHIEGWGVKISKALIKKAEEWDAEIKAVSVATLKGKKA